MEEQSFLNKTIEESPSASASSDPQPTQTAVLAWPSEGDSYEGEVRGSVPHGRGRCVYNSGKHETKGTVYVGEWANGKREGQGKLVIGGIAGFGDEYEGGWKNDVKEGTGTYRWVKGDWYVGEYKNDVREGTGTYTWRRGAKYVGAFAKGMFNGQGVKTDAEGYIVHSGLWKDWQPVPPSTLAQTVLCPIPIRFAADGSNDVGCTTLVQNKHTWTKNGYFWGILDLEISAGIYHAVIEAVGKYIGGLGFAFGVTEKSAIGNHRSERCGCWSLESDGKSCCIDGSGIAVRGERIYASVEPPASFVLKTNVTLAVELDADAHIVYFFVDGSQVPYHITDIPPSMYIAFFNSRENVTVDVKSFSKLAAPTAAVRGGGRSWWHYTGRD